MIIGTERWDFGADCMISLDVMIAYLCSITTMKKTLFLEEKCQKMVKNVFFGHEMKSTDKYSCLVVLSLM